MARKTKGETKMKKKKVGLIIAIIIVTVVVVATAALVALYFFTDLFKSEQQLFWKYISNNSQLTKIVTNENEETQKQWKENNSYTSKGALKLSITAKGQTQEINLGTTSKHNNENDRDYSDLTLYNGNEELLKASYIHSSDVYAIQCKDIYEQYYIGIRNSNLKEFATKMGLPQESIAQIPDSIPLDVIKNTSKISEEEAKYLLDTYFNILMENIDKQKYTKLNKSNITIGDKSYETKGYQLALNQNDIKQILVAILTKAKDDEQTIAIFNKLLVEESQVETIDVRETLSELLENVQNQKFDELNLTISIYNAGNQINKTQININNSAELTLDVDTSNESREYVVLNTKAINEKTSEQKDVIKLTMEKQKLDNMINYTTNLINNATNVQITMNTSLGNIIDNKMENNSKITIRDNDATIEASYYKTTSLANENIEIQELTNSSSVIVNNYPMEQLETFFTGLGKKASQVFPEKIGKLNIQLSDSDDILYYAEGITSLIFTVINANGVPEPIEAVEAIIINSFNQTIKTARNMFEQSYNARQQMDIRNIKEAIMLTQLTVQTDSLSGKDFTNIDDVKVAVEAGFSGQDKIVAGIKTTPKYEIMNWGNINFNKTTRKLEGTITIKSGNRMYLVDFTNQNVEKIQ